MEEINLFEAWKTLASYDVAIWVGIVVAVVIFVIEMVLCKKGIIFSSTYKKKAEAVRKGNVIQGKQISCVHRDRRDGKNTDRIYTAYYEYYVDGKKRKKHVTSTSLKPPSVISLYYTKNPNKVFSEYDLEESSFRILLYIIPIVMAYVVMNLMGFDF